MKEFEVLDSLPALRSGAGSDPSDGGCIMQVVNYLWDRGWNDQPVCVLSSLRALSISVNDRVGDNERQELWHLIPRLMGTNPIVIEKEHWTDTFGNITVLEYSVTDNKKAESLNTHMTGWMDKREDGEVDVEFLEAALDEYDRFTGRKATSCKTFDESYIEEIKETLPKEAFSVSL